uniref:AB hydrolase-1 domain-containing protein n=1 Tax=Moniliophthora roreri TaxID=221103 RepID=A0A0W0FJY6_MONRR
MTAIDENPDTPRRRTISYYLVLLTLVLPVWCLVPVSWIYVLYTLRYSTFSHLSSAKLTLFAVAACEVAFSVYHYHLVKKVSGPCIHPPGKLPDLQVAFTRVLKAGLASLSPDEYDEESTDAPRPGSPEEEIVQLEPDDPRAVDFRNSLRTWFGRAPWSSITLHPIRQWLYWSMFNQDLPPYETLSHAHRAAMEDALDQLQKRLGKRVPGASSNGDSSHIKPLRLTIDKVNVMWRPFLFYCFVAATNLYLKTKYSGWGFRYGNYGGLEYLIRIPGDWNSSQDPRPILFIHGLGLGLFQYHVLIRHLHQTFQDRPLLIILQPSVSQDVFHPRFLIPMRRQETVEHLAKLMAGLGWADLEQDNEYSEEEAVESNSLEKRKLRKGVTLLSHSNGSYVHAWMLKDYPHMITRSCFVDPVTFCSWEGDVCYNFIYRPCTTGAELIVKYFVGTELGVANLLQRHFDWSSNSLWFEEIPNARNPSKTLYLLGGKDGILNAEAPSQEIPDISRCIADGWRRSQTRNGMAQGAGILIPTKGATLAG